MEIPEIEKLLQAGDKDKVLEELELMSQMQRKSSKFHYQAACLLDRYGLETTAISFYRTAIDLGLSDDDLRDAYLGLGSTYRAIGEPEKAASVFTAALKQFPGAREYVVFRAMALYNCRREKEAIEDLLIIISETCSDKNVSKYERAIRLYAADIDRILV